MLLHNAPADLLPFIAIGAFAGVRHAEITRLDWRDISFATSYITIDASNAKTGSRRLPFTSCLFLRNGWHLTLSRPARSARNQI